MIRIKLLRESAGMTQKELSDRLRLIIGDKAGTSYQNLSKIELGRIEPDIDMLIALSTVFDVTVDYLIGHSDRPYGGNSVQDDMQPVTLEHICLRDEDGVCRKRYIPPEKSIRFRKLVEAGFPELFSEEDCL